MSAEAQQFLGEIQEQNNMANDPEYASLQLSFRPRIGTLRFLLYGFLLYFSWTSYSTVHCTEPCRRQCARSVLLACDRIKDTARHISFCIAST